MLIDAGNDNRDGLGVRRGDCGAELQLLHGEKTWLQSIGLRDAELLTFVELGVPGVRGSRLFSSGSDAGNDGNARSDGNAGSSGWYASRSEAEDDEKREKAAQMIHG